MSDPHDQTQPTPQDQDIPPLTKSQKIIFSITKTIIVLCLIVAVLAYFASRIQKFNDQTVLIQVQSQTNATAGLPFPQMAFCVNPLYTQNSLTAGYYTNLSMEFYSNINIDCQTKTIDKNLTTITNMIETETSTGLKCWVINSTDPIVQQRPSRREACPAPPAMIIMDTGTGALALPTVLYYAFLPPGSTVNDTNFNWWQIISVGAYILSYSVEYRITIPQSGIAYQSTSSYFGQSNNQNLTVFNSPSAFFGGFQYFSESSFSMSIFPDFTISHTKEYYEYPAPNIITDLITFVTSIALAVYTFLLASKPHDKQQQPKKWGLVHHLFDIPPYSNEHYKFMDYIAPIMGLKEPILGYVEKFKKYIRERRGHTEPTVPTLPTEHRDEKSRLSTEA